MVQDAPSGDDVDAYEANGRHHMRNVVPAVDRPPCANLEARRLSAYIESMITIDMARTQTDGALVSAATRLAAEGRQGTADLIALLAVLEARKLYAGEGYSSMFRFCVARLRLSEEEAYYRIAVGRIALRLPVVLERLRDGTLTLTNAALLRKHLTEENQAQLLRAVEGRSKREVQRVVAGLAPRPDVRPSLRKLSAPRAARLPTAEDREAAAAAPPSVTGEDGARVMAEPPARATQGRLAAAEATPSLPLPSKVEAAAPESAVDARLPSPVPSRSSPRSALAPPPAPAAHRPAEIQPLAPTRYSLHVTIPEETHDKLRRAQDLLRHAVPDGDLAAVLDRAVTLLVKHLETAKFAARNPREPPAQRPAARDASARPRRQGPAPAPAPGTGEPPWSAAAPPGHSARPPGPVRAQPPVSRPPSRYIPAAVRRAVWRRDQGALRLRGGQR